MQDFLLKVWCSSANRIAQLRQSESGATAVEYAVMVATVATVIIAVVSVVGGKTTNEFMRVNRRLP